MSLGNSRAGIEKSLARETELVQLEADAAVRKDETLGDELAELLRRLRAAREAAASRMTH